MYDVSKPKKISNPQNHHTWTAHINKVWVVYNCFINIKWDKFMVYATYIHVLRIYQPGLCTKTLVQCVSEKSTH